MFKLGMMLQEHVDYSLHGMPLYHTKAVVCSNFGSQEGQQTLFDSARVYNPLSLRYALLFRWRAALCLGWA